MVSFELTDCYADWTEVRVTDGVFFELAVAGWEAEVFASVLDVADLYRSVMAGRPAETFVGNRGRLELATNGDDVVVRLESADVPHLERTDRESAASELRELLRETFDAMDARYTIPPVEERSHRVATLVDLRSSLRS